MPVGASSEAINKTAGETTSGFNFSSASFGIKLSVIRVAATGINELTLILYFCPSIFNEFIKPTTPSFAAP